MPIIDENQIQTLLQTCQPPNSQQVTDILQHAAAAKGLTLPEVATLAAIPPDDNANLTQLFNTAAKVKDKIYGRRVVLFAPLYVSNYCANNCLYCGFRAPNSDIVRITLSPEELDAEVAAILAQGHKRLLMLMGEHTKQAPLDYFIDAINRAYSVADPTTGSRIRRINVEIEPLTDAEFRQLKAAPIGTYTVFQETYSRARYKDCHLAGKKTDYDWRLEVMHRALAAGLNDVGIGALFGLYDWRFEVLALLQHTASLESEFGIGPHTISVPRLQPASGAPYSHPNRNYDVSDTDFKKLVAILRLAVPSAGIILSTRERAALRMELLNLGVSQISAGSRTSPGGYKQTMAVAAEPESAQFSLNDGRTSGQIIEAVIQQGFVPSFCTSCYRVGRVGDKFMQIAKPGNIKTFCQTNALITLQEYINDYQVEADDTALKSAAEATIARELVAMPAAERSVAEALLGRVRSGERDICL